MNRFTETSELDQSPLERFLCEYVTAREGEWEQIEPRVYDILVGSEMTRVAFDPEALPEHPQAQLGSLGSPLFDRLLADAASRWNSAACYRVGLHLSPHNLESRVTRALTFVPQVALGISGTRAMHFPQAIFWFKATFASDQKEDVVMPVGIDLSSLRPVRQLDSVLSPERLSDEPEMPLAEAPHPGLGAGHRTARSHAVRSLSALANARRREWSGSVEKQIERMRAYYARLREEAAAGTSRGADPAAAEARALSRRQSVDREEQLRVAELRKKSELRVELKLTNLIVVYQPKLKLTVSVTAKSRPTGSIELVWDPATESVEPATCPACGQPTFTLDMDRRGLKCTACRLR